jgi:1,4-dihydroxy-2-naphthoate polyprenyltransferase
LKNDQIKGSDSGKWQLFVQASRMYALPVMIMPVLIGSLGAYSWNHVFHFGWFLVTLIGAAAIHLFSNMINDLWDYRNGVDEAAVEDEAGVATHSGLLVNGMVKERTFSIGAWALFVISLICGVILAVWRGPWVLLYGGLGAFFAYFYVAPPLRYGYRGKGYSEISILLSFGVLPVLGSYYVQTMQFDIRAVFASLPAGILTTLVLFNHHFLHWRADQATGKNTLVVVWGEAKSLLFSRWMLIIGYITAVAAVLVNALPLYSIVAILSIFIPLKVYRKLHKTNPSEAYLPLMGASLNASSITGLILSVSLLISGLLG